MIKVTIGGIRGRMGKASASAILQSSTCQLVSAFGRKNADYSGSTVAKICGLNGFAQSHDAGILVSNGISDALSNQKTDVLLDLTEAKAAVEHARIAIEQGIRPVIGVSGLTASQISELDQLCASKGIGAMVIPNFSVGAVLMMEFARQAAKFYTNAEIVELHHNKKVDAPSGTAMHTADMMAEESKVFNQPLVKEKETIERARGAKLESGLNIHSLRLPGLISHQDVMFGAEGELLTIRHQSFDSRCFSKGIVLSIEAVVKLNRLVVGLDHVLLGQH